MSGTWVSKNRLISQSDEILKIVGTEEQIQSKEWDVENKLSPPIRMESRDAELSSVSPF